MTYAAFLALLLSFGEKVRTNWPLILALYQAARALYQALGEDTSEGTLQLHSFTGDELDAEERLSVMLGDGTQAVSEPGRFYKVFMFLKATGLLDKLFSKFGS